MLFSLEKMRVVILGLNYISLYLAKKMSRTNNVVIIYEKTSCEKRFIEELDVIIEKVDRNILTVLQEYTEGVNSIVFISMTNCEELNLLSALKMKKLGAHKTAALIYNNDFYNFDYQIDYILNPLQLVLENIHIKLKFTRLHRVRNIVPGKLNLAVLRLTEGDKYLHLKLAKRKSNDSLIVAVKRNRKNIIPESEIRAEPGDLLYVIYKPGNSNWHRFISNGRMSSRKVFILGGNITGIYLAYHWQDLFRKTIILEKDYSRCEYLASRLKKPLILHGRVTEINLLREEGIDQNSTLVAVNDDDLASLVGSFSALRSHCGRVITVLKSQQSRKTAELMDLKNILTVPELVTEEFMQFIEDERKKDKFLSDTNIVYSIHRYTESRKKLASFENGFRIGAIFRNKSVLIPEKDFYLNRGDKVLIFYKRKNKYTVEEIFGK